MQDRIQGSKKDSESDKDEYGDNDEHLKILASLLQSRSASIRSIRFGGMLRLHEVRTVVEPPK